jgi:hypothetical protein
MKSRLAWRKSIAVLIAGAGCAALTGCDAAPPVLPREDARLELVRAQLKDPASAQFSNVRAVGGVLCGNVNARNSFGGYTGARAFIVSGASVMIDGEGANVIEQARITGALIVCP